MNINKNSILLFFMICLGFLVSETALDIFIFEENNISGISVFDNVIYTIIRILAVLSIFIVGIILYKLLKNREKTLDYSKMTENLLSQIFELSPNTLLITKLESGELIKANEKFKERFTASKKVIKDIHDLWIEKKARNEYTDTLKEKGEVNNYLARIYDHNGNETYVSISAKIIEVNNENFILSYSTEVTEEIEYKKELERNKIELELKYKERTKELEQLNEELKEEIRTRNEIQVALEKSEEKYRSLFEQLPLGVYRTTIDGRFIHANPSLANILGFENVEDLANVSVYDFYIERSKRDEIVDLVKSSNNVIVKEMQLVRKDGEKIWVSDTGRLIADEHGNVNIIDGILQDVTLRKRYEIELQESKERYTKLFESLQDIYFRIDNDGILELISPSIISIGIKPDNIVGKNVNEIMVDQNLLAQFFNILKIKGSISDFVLPVKNLHNELHYISVNSHIYTDNEGITKGIEGIARDITSQIKAKNNITALYSISKAVNQVDSLDHLYESIHFSLSKIINTNNFYIAIYNKERNVLSFPYLIDEEDPYIEDVPFDYPGSITAKLMKNEKALLLHEKDLVKFKEESGAVVGTLPKIWVGVSLKIGGEVIGAMAVQSYKDEKAYDEEDVDLLISVSDQVALAIDRKRASLELKVKLNFIQNLIDTIPSPVLYKDKNKKYLGCNCAFEEFTGFNADDIIGKNVFDIYEKSVAEYYDEADNELLENPGITIYESTLKNNVGELRTVLIHKSVYFNTGGEVEGIVGVLIDITDRKKMENELTWQANINKAVAELSQAIISLASLQEVSDLLLEKIQKLTNSPYGFVGYIDKNIDAVKLLSMPSEFLTNGHKVDNVINLKDCISSDLLINKEPFYSNDIHKDKIKIYPKFAPYINKIIVAPAISGKEVVGIIIAANSSSDYSQKELKIMKRMADLYAVVFQRLKAENEIKKALEQEHELNEMKSRFISMVSHEYRTPLTAIMLSTELLSDYGDHLNSENKTKHFERITQSVQTMNSLLEDIITFNKMDLKKEQLNLAYLDIEKMVKSITSSVKFMYKNKNNIKLNIIGDPRLVHVDESILRKILTNLLTNAIKYTINEKDVIFDLFIQENILKFVVKDSGIGIHERDLERIFEPFHRGENVGSISGTGLGMAIIKNAVELHKGTIKIESRARGRINFCS